MTIEFILFLLVNITKIVFTIWNNFINRFLWKLSGVSKNLADVRNGKEQTNQIHVLDICVRTPVPHVATPSSFMLVHNSFTTTAILKDPHVSLFSITLREELATFVWCDAPIYDTAKHPLMFVSQLKYGKKLLTVPLDIFIQLTTDTDISDRDVAWLYHTGRCGSTLWAQIFNKLPNWNVLSECQPLVDCLIKELKHGGKLDNFYETKKYQQLTTALIKYNVSKYPERSSVFIKTTMFDQYMLPIISKQFPDHKILFAYRDPIPSGKSWYNAFGGIPGHITTSERLKKNPFSEGSSQFLFRVLYTTGNSAAEQIVGEVKPQDIFEWYIVKWSMNVRSMMDYSKSHGVQYKPVKYESLVSDSIETITDVFNYLHVHTANLAIANDVLTRDSQEGTFISRKNRKNNPKWIRTDAGVNRCNEILSFFNLSSLDSQFTMN